MLSLLEKLDVMKKLNERTEKRRSITYGYTTPPLDLFKLYEDDISEVNIDPNDLEEKLSDFGFETSVEDIKQGPLITRYELKLAKGVRLSQIRNVSEDISLTLSGNIRILAPIPNTNRVGIEVANESKSVIGMKNILSNLDKDAILPVALGVDTVNMPKTLDLTKMPHLLVAGQTGSGKSVFLNSIILSLIYTKTPDECQLILVDPKRVEMSFYKEIPHLRCPVVVDPKNALDVFKSLIVEMERRYEILSEAKVRNIKSYNEGHDIKMPYIVTIVDEMADLMMTSGKELENHIVRLAQLARAVGIHLVLATQKPTVKVITGLIKSNMPSRISFKVASKTDSRVILDSNGAEQLIGRGDMLLIDQGSPEPERYHGVWVSDSEIIKITDALKG